VLDVLDDERLEPLKQLSHAQRLEYLLAQERVIAAAQAGQLRVLAVMEADPPPASLPGCRDKDWLHEELACALGIAPGTAAGRLVEAALAVRLPGVVERLSDGVLALGQVRALARAVMTLDEQRAAAVAERVLPDAPGQTYGTFSRAVERAVLAVAPAVEEANREYALSQRRVSFRRDLPGTTSMYAVLADEDAAAIRTILRQAAAAAATDQDTRTVEQRQADTLTDLLLSAATADTGATGMRGAGTRQRRPLIQVSVALSTLLGLDEQPAELDGVGPIPAALARRLADDPSGTWRRLVTDPLGRLIDYGRTVYRPPAALADHVTARDRTCRFPGCRQPAHISEIDHRIAWTDGGPTNQANLHLLCVRHHHLKDETRWQVHLLDEGTTAWISPTGRPYTALPPDPYPTDTTITSPEPAGEREPVSMSARDHQTDPDPPPF
jgi:hypothetical protein